MKNTTICYLVQDGQCLMLYRNKKKDDPNAGKWIGIGGHQEEGESPLDCIRREFAEETGLTLLDAEFRGMVQFLFDGYEDELTFCYRATKTRGGLVDTCPEGELAWVPLAEVPALPTWEGDRYFVPEILSGDGIFCLKLIYQGDHLTHAIWENRADRQDFAPLGEK